MDADNLFIGLHPDDRAAYLSARVAALDPGGDGIFDHQHRIILPDGSVRWLHVRSRTTFTGEGKHRRGLCMAGAVTDITGRKAAEEKILAALKEKEILLREINHRVKNNLQVINSLNNLQAEKIKDKKTRDIFKDSQSRVRAIVRVHEKLHQSADLNSIDVTEYMQSLVTSIGDSFDLDRERIVMRLDIDKKVTLEINKIMNCGLIVTELVTNALKYAFPSGRKGEICISLKAGPPGECVLSVADNGVGFSSGYQVNSSETLGLELVQALGGELGSVSIDGSGGMKVAVRILPSK